jgi:hypothetical protein
MSIFSVIVIVLIVFWLMGFFVINISTPIIHALIVVAVVVFVYDLITRGRNR